MMRIRLMNMLEAEETSDLASSLQKILHAQAVGGRDIFNLDPDVRSRNVLSHVCEVVQTDAVLRGLWCHQQARRV